MERTRNYLITTFAGLIAVALVLAVLFETDLVASGALAGNSNAEFVVLSLMELLTIAAIPVALRLFKTRRVRECLTREKETALLRWGLVRILMLGMPLLADVLLYYLFMQATFGYLAIIVVICMVFVFPGRERCRFEVENAEEK